MVAEPQNIWNGHGLIWGYMSCSACLVITVPCWCPTFFLCLKTISQPLPPLLFSHRGLQMLGVLLNFDPQALLSVNVTLRPLTFVSVDQQNPESDWRGMWVTWNNWLSIEDALVASPRQLFWLRRRSQKRALKAHQDCNGESTHVLLFDT